MSYFDEFIKQAHPVYIYSESTSMYTTKKVKYTNLSYKIKLNTKL